MRKGAGTASKTENELRTTSEGHEMAMRGPTRTDAAATGQRTGKLRPGPEKAVPIAADSAASSMQERLLRLEELFHVVSRSQQGYRELIDSMDDLMFAATLEGEIRAVNQRFAEMAELPFRELVGRNLELLIEEPTREAVDRALPWFIERRFWQGILRIRMKKSSGVRYFDCTLRGVVKDGKVVGVSGQARDVTYERESEARFTQLFETLHEGVYFSTPEGRLLDANPALVAMLGYENKDDLLQENVNELYMDAEDRRGLLQELDEQRTLREREIVLRRKDGKPLICLDTSTAIRDATGAVEDHAGAAARELEEETGTIAGSWRYLGGFYTAPGFTSERMHLYLATDLRPAAGHHGPDEDERLELVRVPFADALAMAERGEIEDAKTQVGLLRVARLR